MRSFNPKKDCHKKSLCNNNLVKVGKPKNKTIKKAHRGVKNLKKNSLNLLKTTSSSVFVCEPSEETECEHKILEQPISFNSQPKSLLKLKTSKSNKMLLHRKVATETPTEIMNPIRPSISKPTIVKLTSSISTDVARNFKPNFFCETGVNKDHDSILLSCLKAKDDELTNKKSSGESMKRSFPLTKNKQNLSSQEKFARLKFGHKINKIPSDLTSFVSLNQTERNLGSSKSINIYKLNSSSFLLTMQPESCLYFIGVVELELLQGSVEVLGHEIKTPFQKCLVYSLQGSSNLGLKAKNVENFNEDSSGKGTILEKLVSVGLSKEIASGVLKKEKKIVLCTVRRNLNHNSSVVWPVFIENNLSFPLFPPDDLLSQESRSYHNVEYQTGCIFDEALQDLGYKEFNEIGEWSSIKNLIIDEDAVLPKVVLCGGKAVGKSTLLRYLVNKSLLRWGRVLVVDCDLGQCEFTVPGCVSATLVQQPLLGPNYTHLTEPLRSVYLGEVDVTKCPESYIRGCSTLIHFARQEHGTVPWLINTMGFTRGFGVTLTCGIIKAVSPTHVVQIQSKDRKLNFPAALEPGFVLCQQTESFTPGDGSLQYQLLTMPSASEVTTQRTRGLSPAEARSLVLLSYLSDMLAPGRLSLAQVTPYMINMDLVELRTTTKHNLTKLQVAAAMNGNLVALCTSSERDEFPNCVGFGIVRGVDWQTNTLYVITPLVAKSLGRVNCLLKGNIALPESLYYNQGGVEGRLPYLAYTSGGATARFAKRDFRSLPTTPATY